MTRIRIPMIALAALLAGPAAATAQSPETAPRTLAATIGVHVFPAAGQTAERQSTDEAACYQWAVENTGTDPFELQKVAQQQAQQAQAAKQQAANAGKGAGAKGTLIGAGAGALIGEIASNDAGKGAAIGAAAGLITGRAKRRRDSSQAQHEVDLQAQQAQAATAEQVEGFKKAFSACLEAKRYVVKF